MRGDRRGIGVLLSLAIIGLGVAAWAAAPESPIAGLEVVASWAGPCPREMPLLVDLNGDGVQDYLLGSAQVDRFKEYMPPEVGSQFGLIGMLMSQKAATGNKNFRYAAAVDGARGTLLWQFEAGALIDAYRLSRDGKRLYLSSQDDVIYALDAVTGKKLWTYDLGGGIIGLSLSEEALVGATTHNRVVGIDPQTGALLWEKSLPIPLMSEGWGYFLEGQGEVYVVSMDDKIHAFNIRTGQERWTHPTKGNPSLKALAGDVLVVADGRDLAGVDLRTGKEAWTCDLGGRPYLEPARVVGDTLITFNGRAGSAAQLVSVQMATGKRNWSLPVQKMTHSRDRTILVPEDMNYFRSSMAFGGEVAGSPTVLFFADRKRVVALQLATGKTLWETPLKDVQSVYLSGDRVVVQDKSMVVCGLDPASGKSLWTCQAGAYLRRVDSIGPLLVATYAGRGGIAIDLPTGQVAARPSVGDPGLSFLWGESELFLSGSGQNWILRLPAAPAPAAAAPTP